MAAWIIHVEVWPRRQTCTVSPVSLLVRQIQVYRLEVTFKTNNLLDIVGIS